MSLGDVNLAHASVVVDWLARAGVSHACLSPGSRSTPIALALDRHPDITVHVHLDERSSAFFALGLARALEQARATRSGVAVACTSGTAAAEMFPAVVEAFQSRVPLVLLTADRPSRLRGSGANQTIDQVELYGKYAAYAEAPLPVEPVPVALLQALFQDAFRAAEFPRVPIHLNLPFDEPLTPEGVAVALDETPPPKSRVEVTPFRRPVEEADALAREVSDRRGLVLLGRTIGGRIDEETFDVLQSLGWPVLAEPASGGRLPEGALSAGQALLGSATWLAAHRPEVVLQLGTAPTTRAGQALTAAAERLIVIDAHFPEPDPEGRATLRIRENPTLVASELIGRPFVRQDATEFGWTSHEGENPPTFEEMMPRRVGPAPKGWLEGWNAADAAARRALDTTLDATDESTGLRIARDLAAWMRPGGTLFVGNSLPIRDLDQAMAPREGLRILANRGASGIDGLVSTALGIAASDTGPTVALIGDLSLIHDSGALLWNGRRELDLVLVVENNGGGAIFSHLPQRGLAEFERLFTTPHGLDLGAICAAGGAGHERIEKAGDLTAALDRAVAAGGVRVVEVLIDPGRDRAQRSEVQAAVDAALRDLP